MDRMAAERAPPAARSEQLSIGVGASHEVSGLLALPRAAHALLVLAHGAGAGMHHPSIQTVADGLAQRGVGTLRYQFPYMERGSRRPDPPALCHATVQAAVAEASRLAPGVPLFAGGRSFGGRMTSQAQARTPLRDVRGLVFLAFPLHPAGKPGSERAAHLRQIEVPMLFIQGTRDELAQLPLLEPVVAGLGGRATLHVLEDADHSFHAPARSGRSDASVSNEALDTVSAWLRGLVRPPRK
jgi:predicted alpha/beta-hydrolase family hydrolase